MEKEILSERRFLSFNNMLFLKYVLRRKLKTRTLLIFMIFLCFICKLKNHIKCFKVFQSGLLRQVQNGLWEKIKWSLVRLDRWSLKTVQNDSKMCWGEFKAVS